MKRNRDDLIGAVASALHFDAGHEAAEHFGYCRCRHAAGVAVDAVIAAEGDDSATVHVGRDHPDTSKAVEPKLRKNSTRRKVLAMVRYASQGREGGLTDDELETRLKVSHQTASAARNALVRGGYLVDSGKRRNTRSGNPAVVWVHTGKSA